MDSYEKTQNEATKTLLKKAGKMPGNKILQQIKKEEDGDEREERQKNCSMLRQVFNEGMEEYEGGKMSFNSMIDDLVEVFVALKSK